MAAKRVRIILDTNWYISATINKNSRRALYEVLFNKNFVLLFSAEILNEYNSVISRDKFKKIVSQKQVARFIDLVASQLEKIELKSELKGSRDLNDNFLLSLSYDGNADYLITGDVDLLVLQRSGSTQIITLRDFLTITSHKTL